MDQTDGLHDLERFGVPQVSGLITFELFLYMMKELIMSSTRGLIPPEAVVSVKKPEVAKKPEKAVEPIVESDEDVDEDLLRRGELEG